MRKSTYVAPSRIHGKGLFANEPIGAGEIIGWLQTRPSTEDGMYVLWLSETEAHEVTCDLKYINHADEPNGQGSFDFDKLREVTMVVTRNLNRIIDRNFCTPVFWSSEDYSADIIKERVTNYIWRTIYQLIHLQALKAG